MRFPSPKTLSWIVVTLLTLLWLGVLLKGYTDGGIRWGRIIGETGEQAWRLLTLTIAIGLLRKVFSDVRWIGRLVPMRKWTGVFALLFAATHAFAIYMAVNIESATSWIASTLDPGDAQLLGWLGLLFMVPALVTGGAYMARRLGGRTWKLIQRFTHVAFVASALHVGLIPYFKGGDPDTEALVILLLYLLGYAYVYLRKKKQLREKAAAVAVIVFFVVGGVATDALAKGEEDATGVDPIFELLGQEKPSEWASWERSERFEYLQSMGVEPEGEKYRGEADLSGYFEWLGVEEPDGWYEMSFDERADFVANVGPNEAAQMVRETAPAEPLPAQEDPTPDQKTLVWYLSALGAVFLGLLMMWIARKTD